MHVHAAMDGLYCYLKRHAFNFIEKIQPAYRSLLVVCHSAGDVEKLNIIISDFYERQIPHHGLNTAAFTSIPVCYDPALGNDLGAMEGMLSISSKEIVQIHTADIYTVFMLGFLPGFPYMGEVDARIATPRKAKPLPTRAGAVGIAGRQTGIYPVNSPGGWHIVGYTPVKMFEAHQAPPALLQPGNLVKFESIPLAEYLDLNKN
jgi:inhibitor of KinA